MVHCSRVWCLCEQRRSFNKTKTTFSLNLYDDLLFVVDASREGELQSWGTHRVPYESYTYRAHNYPLDWRDSMKISMLWSINIKHQRTGTSTRVGTYIISYLCIIMRVRKRRYNFYFISGTSPWCCNSMYDQVKNMEKLFGSYDLI